MGESERSGSRGCGTARRETSARRACQGAPAGAATDLGAVVVFFVGDGEKRPTEVCLHSRRGLHRQLDPILEYGNRKGGRRHRGEPKSVVAVRGLVAGFLLDDPLQMVFIMGRVP